MDQTKQVAVADFGMAFHLATRKSMDGKASSVLWNTIHLMDRSQWFDFCSAVVDLLKEGKGLRDACLPSIQHGTFTGNLMHTAFGMMDNIRRGELDDREWVALEDGIKYHGGWPL